MNTQEIASRAVAHVAVVKTMSPLGGLHSARKLGTSWPLVPCQHGRHRSWIRAECSAAASKTTARPASFAANARSPSSANNPRSQKPNIAKLETQARPCERSFGNRSRTSSGIARGSSNRRYSVRRDRARCSAKPTRSSRRRSQAQQCQDEIEENAEEISAATEERATIEGQLAEIAATPFGSRIRIRRRRHDSRLQDTEVRAQEAELQSLQVNEVSLRERVQGLEARNGVFEVSHRRS